MSSSLFSLNRHPFVWTTPEDRPEVLRNVNDPHWHHFLEEADAHFTKNGQITPPKFPVYCHDGEVDEVMAASVLAYVREDKRLCGWIADWLRELTAYYQKSRGQWQENLALINQGKLPSTASDRNPRLFLEGFSRGNAYWVEAGLMSCVLHLYDMVETYAPEALSAQEKIDLEEALSNFASRYAFNEEAIKYSNRGMWANSGILIAALTHHDPLAARLLIEQSKKRQIQYRSTFFDDGVHGEGSADYHLMALDALLCYGLTASSVWTDIDFFGASSRDDSQSTYLGFPSFVETVKAYLKTAIPGPVIHQNDRGTSISVPLQLRPALLFAYKKTRDPEIGWFIQNSRNNLNVNNQLPDLDRQKGKNHTASDAPSSFNVKRFDLLGLERYQPLLNFWVSCPVTEARPPVSTFDVLSDHGAVFSRSGWDAKSSCVTARFGYEGTGKGHRDHAHLTVTANGKRVLDDPFPRYGHPAHGSSLFHNTVTIDNTEPRAVIGRLAGVKHLPGMDAFQILNSGGSLPRRIYLHDPREESNNWFTNHPALPAFDFQRAVLHVHQQCVVLVDRVSRDSSPALEPKIDWFFHSAFAPAIFSLEVSPIREQYQMQQRDVGHPPGTLEIEVRGKPRVAAHQEWLNIAFAGQQETMEMDLMPLDAPVIIDAGVHLATKPEDICGGGSLKDYFIRGRSLPLKNRVIWVFSWGRPKPEISLKSAEGNTVSLRIDTSSGQRVDWRVDFANNSMELLNRGV